MPINGLEITGGGLYLSDGTKFMELSNIDDVSMDITPEISDKEFCRFNNSMSCEFTFDNSWNVYNKKTAIFYNDPKKSYPVFLDDTNTAVIPSTLIDRGTKLYFGVIGTNANNKVKTSSILSYRIERGAISADVEIPPSSAEIWLQILLNYEIALKKLNDMSNNLENMNNTLEEMDQRFIDAGVENKANKDLSNVANTDFSNKCKSAGVPVINNIPVDLTGIYNTQMIGYDEEQGKLVPMSAVARTQTVLPATGLAEAPYKITEQNNISLYPFSSYNYIYAQTNSDVSSTKLATIKGYFKNSFLLSEFTTMAVNGDSLGYSSSIKIILSKSPDFSVIEAEYKFSNLGGNIRNADITSLHGKYFIRFEMENAKENTSFTFSALKFS